MKKTLTSGELSQMVLPLISRENIMADCQVFGALERFSGSADAEKAASHILNRLEEYGIDHKALEFTGYLSRGLSAELKVISPFQKEYDVLACGFSASVEALEGELYYDFMSEQEELTQKENKLRFADFQDKIIITRHSANRVVREAQAAGARGVIAIYPTPDPVPHYLGTGAIWGNPTPDNAWLLHSMPCINCTLEAGEELIEACRKGRVWISMTTRVSTGPTRCTIPTAYIPGAKENFVLISGHYDAHGYGMTDNGAGDAILLEMARVFHQNRNSLQRSILFCWWSGHEDCPYAGSTWFADNYWQELRDRCVAHVNVDVTGCRNALQIRARTTRMEGKEFTDSLIKEFTGRDPLPYIPLPHVGEQSFLGREIPITVMFKYEADPKTSNFAGVGGGYWWHTRDDTIDKVDYEICMRDAGINTKMACQILNAPHLPVNMIQFSQETENLLREIDNGLGPDFDLSPVYPKLKELQEALTRLTEAIPRHKDTDAIIKKVAGEMIRIQFTYRSPYEYDRLGTPSNFQKFRAAMGVDRGNTDPEPYLFLQTDFVRHRNRFIGEMDKIIDTIRYQLLKWRFED